MPSASVPDGCKLITSTRWVVWLALLVPWLASDAQVAGTHPDARNLQVQGPVTNVRKVVGRSGVPELERLAARLRNLVKTDSIGTVDGPLATVLGRIRDVDVDSGGRVFVLDNSFQMVRVFGPSGDAVFTMGSEGSGPLDFRTLWSGWVENDSTFAVVDGVLGTKYITSIQRSKVALQRVVPSATSVTGGCGAKGLLYTYMTGALAEGGVHPVVRVSDATGRTLRTFGSAYRSESPLVRGVMSEGTIACLSDGASVYSLSKLPFVHYFDPEGRARWTARFTGFVVAHETYEPDENGRWAIGIDPKRADHSYIRRLTPLGKRYLIVQLSTSDLKSLMARMEWRTLDTYLLDIESGRGTYVSDRLPILSAVTEPFAYGFRNDPFPRVLRYRVPK